MNIKEMRILSGMTQQAFGDYFNIPKRTIQNWELGERECSDYILELIHDKLVCDGVIQDMDIDETNKEENKFKELYKQTGMLQKEFAEYFNISLRTIESWSNGRYKCADYLLDLMRYKLVHEGIIQDDNKTENKTKND